MFNFSTQSVTATQSPQRNVGWQFTCPIAVAFYKLTGGADLHDHKRKLHCCSQKNKEWWPRLFYFLIEVSVVNAHAFESLSPNHKKRPLKECCLELAMEYLKAFLVFSHLLTLQTHSCTGQAIEGILDADVLNVPSLEERSVSITNVPYETLDSVLNVLRYHKQ